MDIASLVISVVSDGLDAASQSLQNLGQNAANAQGKVDKFNKNMEGLRNAALGVGAVLTGVLYTSAKAAMDFESAMADVKKVVDFDTPDGLQKMNDDLLEMSTRIPIAATGLAEIAAAAGQSGIAANEITRFTEAAAKMGTAFDITAEQAGTAMAEMRVAFGFTQDEVETLADKINYLGNTTPNAAAGLTEVVQRIGAIAKISGVSADQLAAMAGSVTSLAPEVVATGLKNLMTRLTAGASATKPMKAAWHDLGFTAQEVAKGMQEDSEAMINAVLSSLRKLPKEEQTAYLNTLFGQEALPVVAQLMTNTELLATNLNAMGDASKYAGSMQAEFEARSATTANQLELLKNNVNVAQVALGSALLPAINDIAKAVIPVIQSFTQWADKNPELVVQIIAVTGAVTGAILAISGIGLAISGVLSAISGLAAIFGVAKIAIMALSGPIGLTVIAITGLIMAGALLYQNWDMIKAKATEIWGGIKDAITSKIDDIKSSMSASWDSIKNTTASKAQEAVNAAKNAFNGLPAPIKAILTVAYNVVKTQIDLMKNAFTTGLNIIKAVVRGDMQGVVNAFKTGMSNAWNIVKQGVSNILNAVKDLGTKLFNAGKDAVNGLIRGLKSKIGEVKSAASELGQAAWGGVKSFLQIRSPSRKMAELGKHTADGLAKGIKDNKKAPVSEAQKMAEQAVKAVKDTIANLKKEIVLFGKGDDPLAEFNYDISVGKYAGVPKELLDQNAQLILDKQKLLNLDKERAEAVKALEDRQKEIDKANSDVVDSVSDITKQMQLLNGNDAVSNLMYDLLNSSKYADVTAENVQKLIDKTTEFEKLKAQGAAKDAFYNMTDTMQSESPMGKLIAERDKRLEILEEARALEVISAQQHADTLLAIDQAYMDGKRDLLLNQSQDLFSGLSGLAKSFAGEQSGVYRALFAIEKGFAIAQAAIAIQQSVAKAMAVGFPANIPLIGQTIAQGGQIMSSIKSVAMPVGQAHDGIMSVPKSGTWNLEKGERVLPAHTAKAMDKKLEQGGGTTVNIYNNAAGVEVEQKINDDGSIDIKIEKRIQQSWNNLANPNSHESKMLGRNVQAPRRR